MIDATARIIDLYRRHAGAWTPEPPACSRLIGALLPAALAMGAPAAAQDRLREADYRDMLCAGMRIEVRLTRQSRADCVSDTHAIEVEWADKFKEGVGQALTYAFESELIPGLILVCRRDEASCLAASLTSQETFGAFGIRATVWECGAEARALADCVSRDICANGVC